MAHSKKSSATDSLSALHKKLRLYRLALASLIALFGLSSITLGLYFYSQPAPTASRFVATGRSYYDPDLNFSLTLPFGWDVATMSRQTENQVVSQSTGGLAFGMAQFSLIKPIAPLTLYIPSSSPSLPYSKYMIISFQGSDQNYSFLQNPVTLVSDFQSNLAGLGQKDVAVSQVKLFNNSAMHGILLQGTAKLKTTLIHYYRYFEPAGANILTITYSSTGTGANAISTISQLLTSLIYYQGGAYTDSPFNPSSVPVTQPGSPTASSGIQAKVGSSTGGITVSTNPNTK